MQEKLGEVKRQSRDWLEVDWVITSWPRATCQRDKGQLCDDLGLRVDCEQSRAIIMGTKMGCKAAK